MRKIFAYAAALAAVLLSAPAMAQQGGFGQTVQAAGQGLAQGVISHVDYQQGIVTIQQAGNRIQVHGTPGQLGTLKAGEAVVLPFNNYAGMLWLAPGFNGGSGVAASGFGLQQVIAANVLEINKSQGLLRVAGPYGQMTLAAHPEDIDAVIPGQYVSLSYVDVGNRPWLTGVQLFSQGGFQSSGTMGSGGMTGNVGIGQGGGQFGMQGQQQPQDQGLWSGQQQSGGGSTQQPQQPQQPITPPPQSPD